MGTKEVLDLSDAAPGDDVGAGAGTEVRRLQGRCAAGRLGAQEPTKATSVQTATIAYRQHLDNLARVGVLSLTTERPCLTGTYFAVGRPWTRFGST